MKAPDSWWKVLDANLADIRRVVANYGSRPFSPHAAGRLPVAYAVEKFDRAYAARDVAKLCAIMNDAWFRAPDRREVYAVPGFSRMCDLLDGTAGELEESEDGTGKDQA